MSRIQGLFLGLTRFNARKINTALAIATAAFFCE